MTEIRLWAPRAASVDLVLASGVTPMRRHDNGWHSTDVAIEHGDRYGFSLDSGHVRPDPRSTWLPNGVHSPGAWYDHSRFSWTDDGWSGHSWPSAVVYEMHVGTFTDEGTFDAAVERLDHVVSLGATHVELMPVCAIDGDVGWGYDGVAPWSVHEPYGGPDGLKRFVDAAHRRGLSVLLDVVHNHLGPSGNYLSEFGPYFTDRVSTPWGDAVNLDASGSDEVRAYLLGSVLAWLRDFHLDGVRLDAVHELHDNRALTFLEQLSTAVDALSARLGRPLVTVAESDRNDPRTVLPRTQNGLGLTAQWDDDVHHALHVWLTGESQGYYQDFAADPDMALRTVLTSAFFHADTYSTFRGRMHGRPLPDDGVPGWRFVASLQTHDQVGNRAHGDRLSALVPAGHLAAGAALLLLGPFVPMLFMGEEWGASTPWQFFSSFPDPDLASSVTQGRRAEFSEHGWASGSVPDPQHPSTVQQSRLNWSELDDPPHSALLDWYRTLISLRAESSAMRDASLTDVDITVDDRLAVLRYGGLTVVAWLGGQTRVVALGDAQLIVASFVGDGQEPALTTHDESTHLSMPPGTTAVLR